MTTKSSTSSGGFAKFQRAIRQIANAEKLISSLPKQYDHEKALELAIMLSQIRSRILRELSFRR